MIFVLLCEDKIYFGIIDIDYYGDLEYFMVIKEDVDYFFNIVNKCFLEVEFIIDDIESLWVGLCLLLLGNSVFDYNGGNSGKLSDESFEELIDFVKDYIVYKNYCEDVEKVIFYVEFSIFEKELDLLVVFWGLSFECDDNGLLIFVGGKIIDYWKMVEGVMEIIINILDKEYNCKFKLINFKIYFVLGGEINLFNVDFEIEVYV